MKRRRVSPTTPSPRDIKKAKRIISPPPLRIRPLPIKVESPGQIGDFIRTQLHTRFTDTPTPGNIPRPRQVFFPPTPTPPIVITPSSASITRREMGTTMTPRSSRSVGVGITPRSTRNVGIGMTPHLPANVEARQRRVISQISQTDMLVTTPQTITPPIGSRSQPQAINLNISSTINIEKKKKPPSIRRPRQRRFSRRRPSFKAGQTTKSKSTSNKKKSIPVMIQRKRLN